MIRHVSVLTFVADITDEQVQTIADALATLPSLIPALRSYSFGRDLGIDDGNGSFAVIADFDDTAGYASYRDDPEHRRILAELVRPHLAGRNALQYEVEDG